MDPVPDERPPAADPAPSTTDTVTEPPGTEAAPTDTDGATGTTATDPAGPRARGFLSPSPDRRSFESVFVRVVATLGIVAVGTALGAILVANEVAGWIVGLAVSAVSVLCAAILWRSRQL
jgi:hypothetical protein